jgi:hypothetical protein
LLDIDIEILYGSTYANSFVLRPAGVRVGYKPIGWLQSGSNGMNTFNINIWVTPNLELEPSITLVSIP